MTAGGTTLTAAKLDRFLLLGRPTLLKQVEGLLAAKVAQKPGASSSEVDKITGWIQTLTQSQRAAGRRAWAGAIKALRARGFALDDGALSRGEALDEQDLLTLAPPGVLRRWQREVWGVRGDDVSGGTPAVSDKPPPVATGAVPEHTTAGKRRDANLAALAVLSTLSEGERPSPSQRATLLQYSGWGGLKLQPVLSRLPTNLPPPEDYGLVHEYYTPQRVWDAVAVWAAGHAEALRSDDGSIRALEPSAGIGRALRAFEQHPGGFPVPVRWTAVEFSALSSRMLDASYPDAAVFHGPFERYVSRNLSAKFDLIAANPPFGDRGEMVLEDPYHADFDFKRAYLYFITRGMSLLRPDGLAAYVIPTGLLTGKDAVSERARAQLLRAAHLIAAFRLPSQAPGGKKGGVYDNMPTDLLLLQRRAGELASLDTADARIAEGLYFRDHPAHILGEVVEGVDKDGRKQRRGYQIRGVFTGLPDFTPRPMTSPNGPFVRAAERTASAGSIGRTIKRATGKLSEDLARGEALGLRVDSYLAALASPAEAVAAAAGHAELHRDLCDWRDRYGSPHRHKGLLALTRKGITGAERLLSAYSASGAVIEALQTAPEVRPTYTGGRDLPAMADWLYRQEGGLTEARLCAFARQQGERIDCEAIAARLLPSGWCLDGEGWDQLLPEADYLTGALWPRYDRAEQRAGQGDAIAAAQLRKLKATLGWRSAPSILDECQPTDSWLPLELVSAFASEVLNGGKVTLVRRDGVLGVSGTPYGLLNNTDKARTPGLSRDLLSLCGMANYDKGIWNPRREKVPDETGKMRLEPIGEARKKQEKEFAELWRHWIDGDPARADALETAYNRLLNGYRPKDYPTDPVPVARWGWHRTKGYTLHGYQNAALRRLIDNRRGLLAFDTGLGKSATGAKLIAVAKQQGWAKRPVVVVPNSIVWKWKRDFEQMLPDYRVLVIGSERRTMTRGPRKGQVVAEPDTARERARKWTAFAAGGADVVLLTYSMLNRTQVDADFLQQYVAQTASIRRSILLGTKNKDFEDASGSLTERQEAVVKAKTAQWLGDMLKLPRGHSYDPGIDWHALGIDLLVVDEAQNFKNLLRSERTNPDAGETQRAWALDFRCASVRHHSGGAGVVLLSATPAKNQPEEFYSLFHLIDPAIFQAIGIDNHEAFLSRYGVFEERSVPNESGTGFKDRTVMTRFKNLDELRHLIFRWSEFKVAEEVGLQIPDVERQLVNVETTDNQRGRHPADPLRLCRSGGEDHQRRAAGEGQPRDAEGPPRALPEADGPRAADVPLQQTKKQQSSQS